MKKPISVSLLDWLSVVVPFLQKAQAQGAAFNDQGGSMPMARPPTAATA